MMKQKKSIIIWIISLLILVGITVSFLIFGLRAGVILQGAEEEETSHEELEEKSVNKAQPESAPEEKIEEAPTEEAGEEEEIKLEAPYALAYYEFLKEYAGDSNYVKTGHARFNLVFIDDNEIPELLLMEDNSHANGVKVYTYNQEMVVELGEFGSSGWMQYVERGGMIFGHFMGFGESINNFFRIEEGKATLICNLHSWPDYSSEDFTEFYEIDGISVEEEIYQAKWKELYEDHEYVLIGYEDGIPIKETELKSLLSEAIDGLILKKDSKALLEQVTEQEEVLKSYESFLTDYVQQWEKNAGQKSPGFKLIYLDDDAIPELVIIEGMAHLSSVNVYTYEAGKTIYVGEYGQYGAMGYQEKRGIVFDDYDQGGNVYSSVYQIKGTEETLLISFSERCKFEEGAEEIEYTYTVDGKEATKEQYNEVYLTWNDGFTKVIDYDMCVLMTDADISERLTEELENLILTQEEVLKRNVLIKSGEDESAILLMDYDDYDRDGSYEAFVLCGECTEYLEQKYYGGTLWFAGANQCTQLRKEHYRMIDGKMKLGPNRKYLFFYTDTVFTANISELWTVVNGEPIESEQSRIGQVVYRGGSDFEIWKDCYDHFYWMKEDMWTGHTYKPYFYYYNWDTDEVERYAGEIISRKQLEEICGFDLAEEIEAEGYVVSDIIKWNYKIVTVNYVIPKDEEDTYPQIIFENVIWDCVENDYWRKEQRGVTSWKDAGVGGSFRL
ncbi:MAG: hypothetical protein HDR24_06820 [Lachnospiraceae bacterium]|nr:hypothetical protein [Lachnospiraceae bacterium]